MATKIQATRHIQVIIRQLRISNQILIQKRRYLNIWNLCLKIKKLFLRII